MKMSAWAYCLAACGLAVVLAGCGIMNVVESGNNTSTRYGGVKIYGTDIVPFEFEEVGIIGYYSKNETREEAMQKVLNEVARLKGDAIVNFRAQPSHITGGFVLVLSPPLVTYYSGVAVKIKRP